jgi:hypothetical protein
MLDQPALLVFLLLMLLTGPIGPLYVVVAAKGRVPSRRRVERGLALRLADRSCIEALFDWLSQNWRDSGPVSSDGADDV